MVYRDNSEDYNEKINPDSYQGYAEDYEEVSGNYPNYRQSTPYLPQYYQMMPFYPMRRLPVAQDDDGDLKMLYPKIHIMLYPMVKYHCEMMVSMYGRMYCPSMEEMEHISKAICEKHEKYYRDDESDDNLNDEDYTRQRRRFHRRRGLQDLVKILIIQELLGRRNYGGYGYGY